MTTQEKYCEKTPTSNLAELKETLERILFGADDPIVVALTGDWGGGKTHFWKSNVSDKPIGSVGYVSVFGAETLQEIRERVLCEALSKPSWDDRGWAIYIKKKYSKSLGVLSEFFSKVPGFTSLTVSVESRVPDSMKWSIGKVKDCFSAVFKHLLIKWPEYARSIVTPNSIATRLIEEKALRSGWVLCIDDIERLSSKTIEIDALLGYICELRDERKVKVLLIYNSNYLQGANPEGDEKNGEESSLKKFKDFKEKVIDRELPFVPDVKDAVKLVFLDMSEVKDKDGLLHYIEQRSIYLSLNNIRLLIKTKHYCHEIFKVLPNDVDDDFIRESISTLLLFVWVEFSSNEYGLKLDYFYNHNSWDYYVGSDKSDVNDKLIQEFLHKYGYRSSSKISRVILDYVKTNMLDSEALQDLYREREERRELAKLEAKFTSVWKTLYHGTLRDNSEEFCNEIEKVTLECLSTIEFQNFSSVLQVLKNLGKEDALKRLLDEFIHMRGHSLGDFGRSPFVNDLRSDELKEVVLAAAYKDNVDERSVSEVFESILKSDYISQKDLERMSSFSQEDILSYLLLEDRESLTVSIRHIYNELQKRSHGEGPAKKALETMQGVVNDIAGMFPMNRLRMESMGLIERASVEP